MKLYGAMKMVLFELNAVGGDTTDSVLSKNTRISLVDMRDWLLILEGDQYVTLERDGDVFTAKITPKGRVVLRHLC